jgi:hypothetical protein
MEGIVGTPSVPLYDRRGNRIITKLKIKDFEDLEKRAERAKLAKEFPAKPRRGQTVSVADGFTRDVRAIMEDRGI